MNFKDDTTDFRVICFMQNKSDVFEKFKAFKIAVRNRFGRPIKVLRTDRGREYVNNEMKRYLEKKGIEHEMTAPFTPEQNGKAERNNRTIVECARTLLHARNLPKILWAEATAYAMYILNCDIEILIPSLLASLLLTIGLFSDTVLDCMKNSPSCSRQTLKIYICLIFKCRLVQS